MKTFSRQKSDNAPTANINIDFGAAATKVAHLVEPGEYGLRIDSARVVQNGQNIFVALDLVMMEGGDRIDDRPLWWQGLMPETVLTRRRTKTSSLNCLPVQACRPREM
jgi:hypothetical protein